MLRYTIILLLLLFCADAMAQRQEAYREQGMPFLENYLPKDYSNQAQNWMVAQDPSGVIYVANTGGILEYDGDGWEDFSVNNKLIRCVGVDNKGRVYAAGQNEFGYLVPDSLGFNFFRSVFASLPEDVQSHMEDVWQLFAVGEDIYFNTGYHIVKYSEKSVKAWSSQSGSDVFHTAFWANGHLYVREKGVGLQWLVDGEIKLVPGGERFASNDERIDAIVPFNEKQVLIGTRTQGLLLFDGAQIVDFPSELALLLAEHKLYHGATIGNGLIAFGTTTGGVLIMNKRGELVHQFSSNNGLASNTIRNIFLDAQGSIWLAMDGGIARLEYPSPITLFSEREGLRGGLNDMERYRGTMYVATGQGVYYLVPRTGNMPAYFAPVAGLTEQTWDLLQINNELLAATTHGLYRIEGPRAIPEINTPGLAQQGADDIYYCLVENPDDSTTILAGKQKEGIMVLAFEKGKWTEKGQLTDSSQVRWIAVDARENTIWFGDKIDGIRRRRIVNKEPVSEFFNDNFGLPTTDKNEMFLVDGKAYAATNAGVYSFDQKAGKFLPDTTFGAQFTDGASTCELLQVGPNGEVWLHYDAAGGGIKYQFALLRKDNRGRYRQQPSVTRRLTNFLSRAVYSEPDGVTWFAGELDGLVRFDPAVQKPIDNPFSTRILTATVNDTFDLFEGGYFAADSNSFPTAPYQLSYDLNAFSFSFAAQSYDGKAANEYQYWLEPFDAGWSKWSTEGRKNYTNLSPGSYTFHARSRNAYGNIGKPYTYSFTILPPWYLSWWFISICSVAGIGLVVMAALSYNRYRTRQLEAKNRELEAIVQERTAEVVAQKDEIQKASEEISIKNAELGNTYEEIRAQNENLEQAYHIIEEKNEDITDSIQYASRIQKAFLPDIADIRKIFPQSFVLLFPRDIVSGDYYWFGQRGDYTLLAGADCTGHGVPGAFMSVMGSTLLQQILSEGVVHPGVILDMLDQKVKLNLRQFDANSRTNDGMEMMLWTVNLQTRELMYASASRPMLHIRGGVMTEIKAEKIPIGGAQYRDHRGFEAHSFPYESGDWVYTFSDGFPDQFGGPDGRKFMGKRAKDLILSIHHLPAEEQHAILHKEIKDWMGDKYEQTDDILVMGFQLP